MKSPKAGRECSAFFDFTSRESGRIVFNLRHRPMRTPMPTVLAGTGAARATGRLLLRELPVEDEVVCVILGRHQDRGRCGRRQLIPTIAIDRRLAELEAMRRGRGRKAVNRAQARLRCGARCGRRHNPGPGRPVMSTPSAASCQGALSASSAFLKR
jgi:hypothetical protein